MQAIIAWSLREAALFIAGTGCASWAKALCSYDLHVSRKLGQMEACLNGGYRAANINNEAFQTGPDK